jgi:hypothetical protein
MVMTYLMACYHSPEETEETHEKPRIPTEILITCLTFISTERSAIYSLRWKRLGGLIHQRRRRRRRNKKKERIKSKMTLVIRKLKLSL